MNKTNIGWTDMSSNPLKARNIETGAVGHYCTHISEGCDNCYAGTFNRDRYGTGLDFIAQNRSKVEWYLDERELARIVGSKAEGRCFICDMTDMFHADVSDEWQAQIFGVMASKPNITFQVLTKRPDIMQKFLSDPFTSNWVRNKAIAVKRQINLEPWVWPLPNVWIGTTVENQRWADVRIPLLLDTPGSVHFISAEPLLGPVVLPTYNVVCPNCQGKGQIPRSQNWVAQGWTEAACFHCGTVGAVPRTGLDWVIVGAESGTGRRPMDMTWMEGLASQCKETKTACYVKQGSSFKPGQQVDISDRIWGIKQFPVTA